MEGRSQRPLPVIAAEAERQVHAAYQEAEVAVRRLADAVGEARLEVDARVLDVLGEAWSQAMAEYVKQLEEKLNSVGDDAQLANVDLQRVLQKQQQTLQMLSNISNLLYDTAMAIIRKTGG